MSQEVSRTILHIEDDSNYASIVSRALTKYDQNKPVEVISVTNEQLGQAILRTRDVDLVLLDLNLDGEQPWRKAGVRVQGLKWLLRTRQSIDVVVLSNHVTPQRVITLMSDGRVKDVLLKEEFDSTEVLAHTILQYLN